jgi:hypothetical protein
VSSGIIALIYVGAIGLFCLFVWLWEAIEQKSEPLKAILEELKMLIVEPPPAVYEYLKKLEEIEEAQSLLDELPQIKIDRR